MAAVTGRGGGGAGTPWAAVREALLWAMGRSPAQRLVEQARAAGAGGEAVQDAFYAEAGRALGRGPAGPPHPDAMRQVIEEPCTELEQGEDPRRRRSAVRLAAAAGMGADEVGGDALVDALAALMPGPDWAPVANSAPGRGRRHAGGLAPGRGAGPARPPHGGR
ncbi:hypothetical protein ACFT8W_03040 [Streptomyces hygroscopicus]|uniref:hypothetical protein n=1 Tax=Streptomyces hygroscopicus TaxID=1912 RepID=UPI00363C4A72